jgi:mRNA-degrading endonuclease RelE of RelBE toxin-antitoxin system
MISRSRYEKLLLKEVKELSDTDLHKVLKTVHFFKEEIFKEKRGNIAGILNLAGIWKDLAHDKLEIFSDIVKEREKFSKGRPAFG